MTTAVKSPDKYKVQRMLFPLLVGLALLAQGFFFGDMVIWRSSPDYGWLIVLEYGVDTIGSTSPLGEESGLKTGDKIHSLNGKSYETYEELTFLMDYSIGGVNVYDLERDGERFTVSVKVRELGLKRVVYLSGFLWLLGVIVIAIGALVFMMKPYHGESWAFFFMTTLIGVFITYSSPSFKYYPSFLYNLTVVLPPFLPAALLHLTILFPQRRAFIADKKWPIFIPYLAALILAVVSRYLGAKSSDLPAWVLRISYLYMLFSLVVFLGSTIYNSRRSRSVAVRLQSLIIFAGFIVALLIPLIDMLCTLILKFTIFPTPVFFYLFFLIFFPVSIGYAIVSHDLFEIDVIVRRTYGYLLSTVTIVGAYAVLVTVLNLAFKTSDVSSSGFFSVGFALAVVFLFEPLHKRFQRFVDRLFYRQQYDYRKTIKKISETMTSILDLETIYRTLVGSLVKEMFLENGILLLPAAETGAYQAQVVEGVESAKLASMELGAEDPLLKAISEKDDAVFLHDIELDPIYEENQKELEEAFESFSSGLMVPMKYKEETCGIVSLGPKKSGKMFKPEDLDLVKTMINQSVIAIENARLFEENLEKARMDEELKIASDIQLSMLPDKAPEIEGLDVAANSTAAREVGGDFYDFILLEDEGGGKRLGLVVGDVSGKGMSGAMIMVASRRTYRVRDQETTPANKVVAIANERLSKDVKKGMFVALVYAVVDPFENTLVFSNAGQPHPIICPSNGGGAVFAEAEGDRFPLGIVKGCDYRDKSVKLNKGDNIVLYSDGVVEAMNEKREMYGFDRFMASIEEGRALNSADLLKNIEDDVARFVGDEEQHDDLTIVVVKMD